MRESDISTVATYISSGAVFFSENLLRFFDDHSAAIGAACQVVGAMIAILTYNWNKRTTTKRATVGKKKGEQNEN